MHTEDRDPTVVTPDLWRPLADDYARRTDRVPRRTELP
jgi:hypothetical protein